MKDELSDFDDQTAELMLFLAGELPPQTQQKLRARLEMDATLRQKLAQLQDLQQRSFDALHKLDQTEISETRDRAVTQLAQKAVSQWTVRRSLAPPAPHRTGRQIPWSRYVMSAAAAILLTAMIWPLYLAKQHNKETPALPIAAIALSDKEKLAMLKDTLDTSAMNDEGTLQFATAMVQTKDSDLTMQSTQQ